VRIESITIAAIGAYNPWIHSHCTLEQAVQIDRRMDPGIIRYRSYFYLPVETRQKFSEERWFPLSVAIERIVRARRALSSPCRKLKPKLRAPRRQMNAKPSGPPACLPAKRSDRA
jgi:hypothetical protein